MKRRQFLQQALFSGAVCSGAGLPLMGAMRKARDFRSSINVCWSS